MTQNLWETNAQVPHSCTARDQHKVVGVGLARKVKKKVASGEMRATPAQAAVRLSTSVLQSFGNLDEGSKHQIRAAAMGTGRSLERSLRRAKQKRFHTSLKRLADLRQEDFPDLWQTLRGRMANLLGINPQNRRERREARAEERARLRAAAALRRIEEEPPAESGPEDNNPSDQSEDESEHASSVESSASSDEENLFE
ncbi:hypothetical protein AAVH_07411 [Aphelenchoides avenae]|nr:hypothetical protein AAVH_07411 [Aphelenchus avenae]